MAYTKYGNGTTSLHPSHAPPADVVRPDPFLQPSSQLSQPTDPALALPTTDPAQQGSATKASSSTQPEPTTTPAPTQPSQRRLVSAFDTSKKETSLSSDYESDSLSSDRPPVDIFPEEGELSEDQEANLSDHDQSLSEKQSYRETMMGIRS